MQDYLFKIYYLIIGEYLPYHFTIYYLFINILMVLALFLMFKFKISINKNINIIMIIILLMTSLLSFIYQFFNEKIIFHGASFALSYFDIGFTKRILPGTVLDLLGFSIESRPIIQYLIYALSIITIIFFICKRSIKYFDFRTISLLTLLLFSPILKLLMVYDWNDIILIGIFLISLALIEKEKYILLSIITSVSILIHESTIVFFTPILGVFILYKNYENNKILVNNFKNTITFSILPLLTIFFVLAIGFEPKGQVISSFPEYDGVMTSTYEYTLNNEFLKVVKDGFYELDASSSLRIIQMLILSIIYILFLKDNKIHKTLFLLAPFVGSIIFFVAADWARFMYLMQFNMLIIILFLPMVKKNISYYMIDKYKFYYLGICLIAPITYFL